MKPIASQHRSQAGARAFSLFEIVIAMSILAMLAGTIFGIVWKAGDAAAEIRDYDTRDEQVARFLSLMRQTIESLPDGAKMTMSPPEETSTGFYEMTISGAPTSFAFGERNLGNGDTIVGRNLDFNRLPGIPESQLIIAYTDAGADRSTNRGSDRHPNR